MNFNKKAIHLNGSGTITFETQIGRNSSTTGPFTQNGPTVNIDAALSKAVSAIHIRPDTPFKAER